MAFGWKTEYEKRMPSDGLSNWEVFSIARKACENLDWDYLVADERTFTATTPINWTLNEEIITIAVEGDTILFKSKSENLELMEAGRNQKNIDEELLPAFKKAREKFSAAELQSIANSIRTETLNQLKSGNRIDSGKMTFGLKDHEVTFLLIAIQLVFYIAMLSRGTSFPDPSIPEILSLGGSMRSYITGGEWWRLVIAIFVPVSFIQLLVNITTLYFIGLMVESILGKVKFLIAFVSAGVLANLASIVMFDEVVIAGSSGAIFGLYGIFLAFATTPYINKKFPKVWLLSIVAYLIFSTWVGVGADVYNAINFSGLVAGICIGYAFYLFHFRRKIARAGGTRISVEILLVTSLLIFLYVRSDRNDSRRFEKAVMKLNQIEVKAMTQMQKLQYSSDAEAAAILRDSTLPEWRHFQKELVKTDKFKLDEEFTAKRKLLNQYARMRIKQTELIYNSVKDGSDKNRSEIEVISDSIDRVIDQLGY
jgi:rhomboid protease GluP